MLFTKFFNMFEDDMNLGGDLHTSHGEAARMNHGVVVRRNRGEGAHTNHGALEEDRRNHEADWNDDIARAHDTIHDACKASEEHDIHHYDPHDDVVLDEVWVRVLCILYHFPNT